MIDRQLAEDGKTMESKKYLTMSELSEQSGVSKSKIRYYIVTGVLDQPIKLNKTTALYSPTHLEQLNIIRECREQKKHSLAAIRKSISSIYQNDIHEEPEELDPSEILKNQVVDLSVEVFRKKGYERVTITDITNAAGISRNSFYKLFKNKSDLFSSCLTKLFLEWRREAPDKRMPYVELITKMSLAHYKVFPRWNDMMNMFRAVATRYPDLFANKLEESLRLRISPIRSDIERNMEQGVIRKLNADLAAIILAGQLDYVCYFMARGTFGKTDPSVIIEQMVDIFFNGIKGASLSD
jgi:AcrR family transcriptional regulator